MKSPEFRDGNCFHYQISRKFRAKCAIGTIESVCIVSALRKVVIHLPISVDLPI